MSFRKTRNKDRERLVVKDYRGRTRVSGKSLDAYLIDLWRDIIFARDEYRCRRCKRPWLLQGHHVHSRRYWQTRHDPDNGLTLCRDCHHWWHMNREMAYDWFVHVVGETFAARLKLKISTPCHNPDLELRAVDLEQQHRELRGASHG